MCSDFIKVNLLPNFLGIHKMYKPYHANAAVETHAGHPTVKTDSEINHLCSVWFFYFCGEID